MLDPGGVTRTFSTNGAVAGAESGVVVDGTGGDRRALVAMFGVLVGRPGELMCSPTSAAGRSLSLNDVDPPLILISSSSRACKAWRIGRSHTRRRKHELECVGVIFQRLVHVFSRESLVDCIEGLRQI